MTRANAGTKGVARADREQQILDVAARHFGEQGYAVTSVAEVAAAAGISKPLIYQYFGSKEGLYAACLERAGALLSQEIARTAAVGEVGLARGLVTLAGVFDVLAPQPWIWRLVAQADSPASPPVTPEVEAHRARILALAEEGVGELMRLAGNDDALDVSAMTAVWTSIFDALVDWWLEHPDETPAAMTERCVRLFSAVAGLTVG